MKWSFRVGRFVGIDVYVHVTFLLLVAWIGLSEWLASKDLARTAIGLLFVLAIFLCVVLHEYGHALMARRFGVRTRDIILLPIGGIARLERIPSRPSQELWVALAGPAVNVVIAVLLGTWLALSGTLQVLDTVSITRGNFVERLLIANLFMVVFNMIPAFPMDGGRVLRALLALIMPYARATRWAAGVGQALAVLFALVGLFLLRNPFLLLIALFVWTGAAQEASAAQVRVGLAGIPLTRLMLTDFHVVAPEDPLAVPVELTLAGSQKDFPVVAAGRTVGLLTQAGLLRGLADLGRDGQVHQAMEVEFRTAEQDEGVESVLARFQEWGGQALPVTRGGELVGLVTLDNIEEFLRIRAALGRG